MQFSLTGLDSVWEKAIHSSRIGGIKKNTVQNISNLLIRVSRWTWLRACLGLLREKRHKLSIYKIIKTNFAICHKTKIMCYWPLCINWTTFIPNSKVKNSQEGIASITISPLILPTQSVSHSKRWQQVGKRSLSSRTTHHCTLRYKLLAKITQDLQLIYAVTLEWKRNCMENL